MNELQTKVTNTCLDLQLKVTNAYHHSTEVTDTMQGMRQLLDRVHTRYEGQNMPGLSPCALATRALYADRGSDEGSIDYKCRLHTRARFEDPRPSGQPRIKGDSSSPQTRNRVSPTERNNRQMAELHARAFSRSPRGQTSGPLSWVQDEPIREPSEYEGFEEVLQDREGIEPRGSSQRDHAISVSPTRPMLDQDYARRSMSVRPQQMVGTVTGPTQGQSVTTITPPLLAQGDSDHETSMIERLKNNIRESLVGIPDNLLRTDSAYCK